MKKLIFTTILIFLISSKMFAVTNYVSLTGNHVSPFANWTDAATNIQAAVDVGLAGDTVLVNDGTYYPASQIFVTNSITVKSVNGAEKTVVDGSFPDQTNRCFYLANNSTLDGFIITNGSSYGCSWSNISNGYGGGIFCSKSAIVQNCIISGNLAAWGGGGVFCSEGAHILNCIITGNSVEQIYDSELPCYYAGNGGGVVCVDNGIVQNSTINKNSAKDFGGGAYLRDATLLNCIINKNQASDNGGGVFLIGGTIQNCIISENQALNKGGAAYAYNYNLVNSTICKNQSTETQIDGVYCEDANSFIYNSIIYDHKKEGLWFKHGFGNNANRVKTLATQTKNCWFGRPPGFIDIQNNDFRLSRKSPCINRGTTNFDFSLPETDLDGNPRVMNGKIDIGAYECNRNIFVKYNIKWNKSDKDKIILKSKLKDYKILGESLSVKIGNSFIVSNLEPFKVTTKVAKYKSDSLKFIATIKTKSDGVLAKVKCLKLNDIDNMLNITNATTQKSWQNIDVEYYLGTNKFTDKINTKYRAKKDKFCKGMNP